MHGSRTSATLLRPADPTSGGYWKLPTARLTLIDGVLTTLTPSSTMQPSTTNKRLSDVVSWVPPRGPTCSPRLRHHRRRLHTYFPAMTSWSRPTKILDLTCSPSALAILTTVQV